MGTPATAAPGNLAALSSASRNSQSQVDLLVLYLIRAFRWLSGKESACQCRRCRRCWSDPWIGKIPCRRKWQSTPVFLLEEPRGQKSLVSYGPWALKELDTIEQLSTHKCTHTHMYTHRHTHFHNASKCLAARSSHSC